MQATIYHNPRCSTSRKALDALRTHGIDPTIVEYLKDPPSRSTLEQLLAEAGLRPSQLLRRKEPLAAELGLTEVGIAEDRILEAMLAHPVLIERPIVTTSKGTRLCRPIERVEEVL